MTHETGDVRQVIISKHGAAIDTLIDSRGSLRRGVMLTRTALFQFAVDAIALTAHPAPSGWQQRCGRVANGLETALSFTSRLDLDTAVRVSIKELRGLWVPSPPEGETAKPRYVAKCSGCGYLTDDERGATTCKGYCFDNDCKVAWPCPNCGRKHYWTCSFAQPVDPFVWPSAKGDGCLCGSGFDVHCPVHDAEADASPVKEERTEVVSCLDCGHTVQVGNSCPNCGLGE